MITAWIALQDTNDTNGCLRTIVGSHKWGLVPDSDEFFNKDLASLKDRFEKEAQRLGTTWTEDANCMRPGQIAFHHALTFHGSGPNITDQGRAAIAVHMMSKDCGYQSGHGWHHNVRDMGPNLKEGDLFAGPNFPVLYNRD